MTAFVANTNNLDLIGLKSAVSGNFISGATIGVVIKDNSGAEVSGQTWPTPMLYVDGSDGDYRAIISHEVGFVPGLNYVAEISVDAGGDRIGFWKFSFRPATRRD
jgi:hypothetical protein